MDAMKWLMVMVIGLGMGVSAIVHAECDLGLQLKNCDDSHHECLVYNDFLKNQGLPLKDCDGVLEKCNEGAKMRCPALAQPVPTCEEKLVASDKEVQKLKDIMCKLSTTPGLDNEFSAVYNRLKYYGGCK